MVLQHCEGLEKSRNLMTVRIAQNLGVDKIANFTKRMNIYEKPEEFYQFL